MIGHYDQLVQMNGGVASRYRIPLPLNELAQRREDGALRLNVGEHAGALVRAYRNEVGCPATVVKVGEAHGTAVTRHHPPYHHGQGPW